MTRRLLLAFLLSALVHVWMVGGLEGWLPDMEPSGSTPIRVELAPLSVPSPAAKPMTAKAAEPTTPAPPKAATKPVQQEAAIEPEPDRPSELPVPSPVGMAEPPAPEVAPPSPSPAPPPVAAAVEPEPPEAPEPAPRVPARVAIDYQILRKGGVAGVEHHSYQAGEDGRYELTSLAEAKGLLALAVSDLLQRSEGQVTPSGLRPSSYLYQYGKNTDKAQKATFDWQGGTLVMEVGSRRRQTAELHEGTQDLMSFMYQFMFVPPLQEMRLAVTNGKKLKIYHYGFEGEETLETVMGALRTLRIGKSGSDGEEKTEIWLAADYHYLPVKISKTEKDGTVTERIATRLQIQE